ncbi:MAG: type II secretion system major pseudopilin GspG [Phycisphaerales bacterium]|nr:type II secretion system major pseudopilin GspG [Phycisphaerae bacterium]NNF42114.1 type II secretion system major pseudopilin GspG [Phycisphaerales bacterium]NNM26439.1 type II secretion system major pseudopilin GspG [Phycisphaerales bacterium]
MNTSPHARSRPCPRPRRRPASRVRRGFSLIELLIVIAILLAIGGLVVVNLLPARDQADIDLTRVQIDVFEEALKRFNLDLKRWPSEDEGVTVLWSGTGLDNEEDEARWRGPYLEDPAPRDLWNNEWIYRAPSEIRESAPYDIISMGPDGEEDTEDDVHNHLRMMNEEGELDEEFDDFSPAGGGTAGS